MEITDLIRPQFNSVGFLLAFTLLYLLYTLFGQKVQNRNWILLGFSLFFYSLLSGTFVFLMIGMAYSDFWIGRKMMQSKENIRHQWRNLSLVINLGILAAFKYFWFFSGIWFDLNDIPWHKPETWMVPVGLSFFVFKSLSYILDLYSEEMEESEKSFPDYLLFVSFFPTILAGPISFARDLLPELRIHRLPDKGVIGASLFLILTGMIKKFAFADYLAINMVDRIFDNPGLFTGVEHLLAAYGYTFQLYLDFSGYTEMMIGAAGLFGIRIKENFNQPFIAQNISEFWRRWHISLSSWFQEYVFTPLNFSWRKMGKYSAILAVIVTFLLSGLWHGAAWTFVLWGLLHGLAIGYDFISLPLRKKAKDILGAGIWKIMSIIFTLHFVVFTVILFRSDSLENAHWMIESILTRFRGDLFMNWVEAYAQPFYLLLGVIILHFLPVSWTKISSDYYAQLSWPIQAGVLLAVILFVFQFISSEQVSFQYLEF